MEINGISVIAKPRSGWDWFTSVSPDNHATFAVSHRELIASAIRLAMRNYPRSSDYMVVTEYRFSDKRDESGNDIFISIQYDPQCNLHTSSMGGHFDPVTRRYVWSIYAD